MAQVNERIVSAKQITSLCAVVKQPEMALEFIKCNKSIAEARATLVELAAKADEDSHVDTSPKQAQQSDRHRAKPKVSTASLWASHNAQSK
jgi:predicted TIM-barrel enzyme